MTDTEWRRAKAKEWRDLAATARDPAVAAILVALAETAEAEIAQTENADDRAGDPSLPPTGDGR